MRHGQRRNANPTRAIYVLGFVKIISNEPNLEMATLLSVLASHPFNCYEKKN